MFNAKYELRIIAESTMVMHFDTIAFMFWRFSQKIIAFAVLL